MVKIKSRYIGISLIITIVLILFFGFEWANNMVSYKYQVQDFLKPGPKPLSALNADQLNIISTIYFCKHATIACCALLVGLFIINEKEPSFKGRIEWV
jgi:hypothetical protein